MIDKKRKGLKIMINMKHHQPNRKNLLLMKDSLSNRKNPPLQNQIIKTIDKNKIKEYNKTKEYNLKKNPKTNIDNLTIHNLKVKRRKMILIIIHKKWMIIFSRKVNSQKLSVSKKKIKIKMISLLNNQNREKIRIHHQTLKIKKNSQYLIRKVKKTHQKNSKINLRLNQTLK